MIVFLFILGVVVFLIWNHFHWQALPWPTGALQVPPFQAHRGYHQIAQENTLASFRAAKNRGAQMIELDVHLSKDHIAVVFHDKDLQRLANDPRLVTELTAAEIKSKIQAPTLLEVLADPQIPSNVNIEIKSDSIWNPLLEKTVADVIVEARAEKRVLISSFNPLSLYRMSKLLPQVPRALLASREDSPGNRFYLQRLWLAPYVNVQLLHLDYNDVSLTSLKKFQARGIPVALWTLDDAALGREYLSAGAFSLISNVLMQEADLQA